jgi:SAM-dependent methyltransferase
MAIQGWDLLGRALKDFYNDNDPGIKLKVHSDCSGVENLPAEIFFRHYYSLPELERYALDLCQGRILDVGAGAGCHSLILQGRGFEVTAADVSRDAAEVMKDRGLLRVIKADITKWKPSERFDTVLMLMNGIGLVENLDGLKLLTPDGQLLLDSTDFTLFPKFIKTWAAIQAQRGRYFGEVEYKLEYQDQLSDAYSWLFVDQKTLKEYAWKAGWLSQIIFEEEGQYLARLTLR